MMCWDLAEEGVRVGTERILDGERVVIERKRIKNAYLRVLPDGGLLVRAPMYMSEARIRGFIADKRAWIEQQRARQLPLQPPSRYETGETIPYFGEMLMLLVEVRDGRTQTEQSGGALVMRISPDADERAREAALDGWYKKQLLREAETLLPQCEALVGKRASALTIRAMTTRWGTCNTATARVTLNLRLVEKPPMCLRYVILHELCHLHEANHSARFWARMDEYDPNWKQARKLLRS